MAITDWTKIDDRYFEKFVYYLLAYEGDKFYNRIWFGRGGGDKGRDVVAKTFETLPFGLGYERKWIFQCKRWKNMPDQGVLYKEAAKAAQHNPDYWVLVIPIEPSAGQYDYVKFLEEAFVRPFKVWMITLSQIQEILEKYPVLESVLLNGEFPKTIPEPPGVKKIELEFAEERDTDV
ncbi:restriction endonuclease [Bacillus cereus]|uniref:restriction endonuclease n=1 Tax=Bacillus cereus TaxID=1396 RepID=UPI0011301BBC|nr:restriction endonuclease [Bacillus cereus]